MPVHPLIEMTSRHPDDDDDDGESPSSPSSKNSMQRTQQQKEGKMEKERTNTDVAPTLDEYF